MEVNNLYTTEAAKLNFVKGLLRAALADGLLEEGERFYLDHLMVGLGLSDEGRAAIHDAISLDSASDEGKAFFHLEFENKAQKMYLLEEVVQVSGLDEDYTDEEKALVRELAADMGVSEAAVEAVEQWAEAGRAWQAQGDALLAFEG